MDRCLIALLLAARYGWAGRASWCSGTIAGIAQIALFRLIRPPNSDLPQALAPRPGTTRLLDRVRGIDQPKSFQMMQIVP